MRIVLFGGCGFLGSHLAQALEDANCHVRIFDRPAANWSGLPPLSHAELRVGDFTDSGDVRAGLEGCDAAVHLVCTSVPATSNEDPWQDVHSNLLPTLRFCEEARTAQIRRIVFLSSGGTVYGAGPPTPIPETHPTEPLCSYGIVKLAIEKYLHLFARMGGASYAVARVGNAYGERQNPRGVQGAVSVFLRQAIAQEPVEIWGDGEVVRDYVYAGDVASAVLRLLGQRQDAGVYNIGTGRGTSLNELIETIRRVTGSSLRVIYHPSRLVDVPWNVLDVSRARRELGWQPQVDLAEGIQRTWRWQLEQGAGREGG